MDTKNTNAVSAKGLCKTYSSGTKALNQVNFSIEQGEKIVVLGHNGSGKSTLFKILTGFEKITEGDVWVNGVNLSKCSKKELKQLRAEIGLVFQHFNLIDNISVFQNVLFGAMGQVGYIRSLGAFASDELREEAMRCLERVGLAHLASKRSDQISGGQKQRIAIARMLMQKPKLVLADEPIAALDPEASRKVMDLLVEIADEYNLTLVCVLHQMPIALEYGERIIGLKEGVVCLEEHVESVIEKGGEEYLSMLYTSDAEEEIDVKEAI